jgi:hypothetical protein
MNQVSNRLRVEAEALLTYRGDKTGTGFEVWIVKLAIALILFEMSCVFGTEECTLMVIKPPGYIWGTGILKIDYGVLVAIEILFIEKRAGPVQQPRKNELHVVANSLPVEA